MSIGIQMKDNDVIVDLFYRALVDFPVVLVKVSYLIGTHFQYRKNPQIRTKTTIENSGGKPETMIINFNLCKIRTAGSYGPIIRVVIDIMLKEYANILKCPFKKGVGIDVKNVKLSPKNFPNLIMKDFKLSIFMEYKVKFPTSKSYQIFITSKVVFFCNAR